MGNWLETLESPQSLLKIFFSLYLVYEFSEETDH